MHETHKKIFHMLTAVHSAEKLIAGPRPSVAQVPHYVPRWDIGSAAMDPRRDLR